MLYINYCDLVCLAWWVVKIIQVASLPSAMLPCCVCVSVALGRYPCRGLWALTSLMVIALVQWRTVLSSVVSQALVSLTSLLQQNSQPGAIASLDQEPNSVSRCNVILRYRGYTKYKSLVSLAQSRPPHTHTHTHTLMYWQALGVWTTLCTLDRWYGRCWSSPWLLLACSWLVVNDLTNAALACWQDSQRETHLTALELEQAWERLLMDHNMRTCFISNL